MSNFSSITFSFGAQLLFYEIDERCGNNPEVFIIFSITFMCILTWKISAKVQDMWTLRIIYIYIHQKESTPFCFFMIPIYATAALTLDSTAKQTLFYQVHLWDSRSNDGCRYYSYHYAILLFFDSLSIFENPCEDSSSWFSTSNPYGVNFAIASFDQSCLSTSSGRGTI